jgi:beta-glucosidase/6-phospho-beta-glucosidase/beta-galactosidase
VTPTSTLGLCALPRSTTLPSTMRSIALCLLLCSCHPDTSLTFPRGFLWGVATSAHESEGRNLNSDWQAFEELGRVGAAGWAQNSLELFDVDAANAKSLGLNAFQLGIEWARVVPQRPRDPFAPLTADDVDPAAVAHYHQVLTSLRSRGITPIVAITHFSLPRWVHNPAAWDESAGAFTDGSLGGWAGADTARAMAQWADFLAREYGDQVQWWITLDEPLVVLVAGYMSGDFPPGLQTLSLAADTLPSHQTPVDVVRRMLDAHAQASRAVKAVRPQAKVGFAQNSVDWVPKNASADTAAAERVHHAWNLSFIDALTVGDFDPGLVGDGPLEHHPEWAGTLDYLGVNYYDAAWVVDSPNFLPPISAVPCSPALKGAFPEITRALGCPDTGPAEPPGMTRTLERFWDRYQLPILITESGFIDTPEGKSRSLLEILSAVHEAVAAGVDVKGYCYWTLNHDYEWNQGWKEDMGLYGLPGLAAGTPGPDTDFTRVAHLPFTEVLKQVTAAHGVSDELRRTWLTP